MDHDHSLVNPQTTQDQSRQKKGAALSDLVTSVCVSGLPPPGEINVQLWLAIFEVSPPGPSLFFVDPQLLIFHFDLSRGRKKHVCLVALRTSQQEEPD